MVKRLFVVSLMVITLGWMSVPEFGQTAQGPAGGPPAPAAGTEFKTAERGPKAVVKKAKKAKPVKKVKKAKRGAKASSSRPGKGM
jgi:hypothetical protein